MNYLHPDLTVLFKNPVVDVYYFTYFYPITCTAQLCARAHAPELSLYHLHDAERIRLGGQVKLELHKAKMISPLRL